MKRFLLWCIRFYQTKISPDLPPCCRYMPTCSQYALEAIQTRGVFVGLFLTAKRLLRCNPFGGFGYDPVPQRTAKKKKTDRKAPQCAQKRTENGDFV